MLATVGRQDVLPRLGWVHGRMRGRFQDANGEVRGPIKVTAMSKVGGVHTTEPHNAARLGQG